MRQVGCAGWVIQSSSVGDGAAPGRRRDAELTADLDVLRCYALRP